MSRLIDLSHPLEHGQLNFPFDPKIAVVAHNTVASIGYNITQISLFTHQGTHLDVPYHFYNDGKTVDQVPLDRFYGSAALVDWRRAIAWRRKRRSLWKCSRRRPRSSRPGPR